MLVCARYKWCEDAYLTTAAHSAYLLHSIDQQVECQRDKEEEAAYNVCGCLESGFCSFLRFGLDVFNTSEAAIVVMVVATERPMISTEAECESQRVLLEFLWAQLTIFGIQCTIVRQLPR